MLGAAGRRLPGRHQPRFADIFRNNSTKAGLLTVVLPQADVEALWAAIEADPATAGDRRPAGRSRSPTATSTVPFEIDDYTRWRLLEGLDDVGLTERNLADIEAFEAHPARPGCRKALPGQSEPSGAERARPGRGRSRGSSPRAAPPAGRPAPRRCPWPRAGTAPGRAVPAHARGPCSTDGMAPPWLHTTVTPGRPGRRAAARRGPARPPGRRRTPPRRAPAAARDGEPQRARRAGSTVCPAAHRAARTAPPSARTAGSTSASRRGLRPARAGPAAAGRRARPSPSRSAGAGRAGRAAACGIAGRRCGPGRRAPRGRARGVHSAAAVGRRAASAARRPRRWARTSPPTRLHHPVVDPLGRPRATAIARCCTLRRPDDDRAARSPRRPRGRAVASGVLAGVELALGQRPVVVARPVHDGDLDAAVRPRRRQTTPPAARTTATPASASVLTDALPAARPGSPGPSGARPASRRCRSSQLPDVRAPWRRRASRSSSRAGGLVADPHQHLDPAVEVAVHQVGAAEPVLRGRRRCRSEITRECSRNRPTIERTRMFSDSPGTPGRSAQMPRTSSSTGTPACEAP